MPIYEYRCPTCGVFDVMQRITAKPLRKCPSCKGKVTKLISSTAFQLKGTGWYVTDYANKGKGKASGEVKESTPGKAAAGETASPTSGDSGGAKSSAGSGTDSGPSTTATSSS